MTEAIIYASASDGWAYKVEPVYADARDALTGGIFDDDVSLWIGQKFADPDYHIYRTFLHFDTSVIPSNAIISAAILSLHGENDYSGTDFSIQIQNGQPTYPHDPLVGGDYNRLNYSGLGGNIYTSGFTTTGYNNITLSSTGRGWIQKGAGALTKLCVRSSRDGGNQEPSGLEYVVVYAREKGGDYRPKLTVTYELLSPPDPPTNVQATDGVYTDKVRITWTKSTGATGYQVYRDGVALGWLGDVATFDDTGAGAPSITPGSAIASDGVYVAHVALSLSGQSANNGATHTYKVKAKNAAGESGYSGTNTGYRGHGALTYQWQRSAGDSDASYSNISGATASTYNDTGAPADGSGRYYRCVENAPGATQQISAADRGYRAGILAPTVTNSTGASNIQETTARLNGQVTANGGENPTVHIYWGETDGVTTPGNWDHDENLGVKAVGNFYKDVSGLTPGKTYYYRCYATNSGGSDWADSTSSFTTKPAAPTNVSATDGVHTDKVVITWTKSTGATGYQVYRDGVALGWLGDVATYDDAGAGAPSITPGAASASDGTSVAHVALSLSGQSANNGTAHTYKVRAKNATGESADSTTNAGYRGHGLLTYQWQRSAGDSDASYSNIAGATTAAYNDIGAPTDGSGRYYRCVENATGAAQATSTADRGYRITSPTVTTQPVSNIGNTGATGNVTITDDGGEACSKRGICWNTTGNPTTADSKSEETDSFGVGAFTRLMTGLTPGQKYYAKGYAINSAGTSYGGEVSFTTKPSAPTNLTATTISETQINLTWTKGTGAVNTVIRRKVNSAPTSVTDGVEVYNGPGTSHNDITCSPGNHYYYRAWSYHTTSGYSDSYDTADSSTVTMPTGTTEAATLLGDVNTTLNGKVTDDGGEPCLVRFQYGTTAAYGTNTNWQTGKVTDDTFSQRITGLRPLTGYHFRAQIKNSAGEVNGADKTFTTISFPTPFLRRVLRDTFGSGSDISAANPLPVDTTAGAKEAAEILDEDTIIAGATTVLGDCAAIDLSDGDRTLTISLEATYDGAATQGIKIHVRTSYDGTNWDTIDWDSWTSSFTIGATIRQTKHYDVSPMYIKVLVENLDPAESVTAVKIIAVPGP